MKKATIAVRSLILALLLASCGGGAKTGGSAEGTGLSDGYQDALAVPAQLALGSLQLEETDLAIDEALAAELLPLWQAYQSLSGSDTAAEVEVTAVIDQIQDTMTTQQIEAIAAMKLTAEDATTYMTEMGGAFGRPGGMDGAQTDGGGSGSGAGRFFGGGFGRPTGGGMPGMGFPEGGQANEDARATHIAQMGDDPDSAMAGFRHQVLVSALIRSLQAKTGEVDAAEPPGRRMGDLWSVVSESTGIPVETLQEEMAEGATLAEVIAAHDGDLEAVEAALKDAFSDLPAIEGEDLDQRISDLLSGSFSPGSDSE